jgi:creatinine amidohydrolase/Fe(II)-dependent formamide hydrolase-like protein
MSDKTTEIRRLQEMLPGEIAAYFESGGDLAVIPIGSIEQHGPNLLTGTDGYITLGKAEEVGRLSGGVVFPMISYCWEGVTNTFSAGVGVREEVFVKYLQALVRGVRRAGFGRILVINSHGGNYYAMRALPQQCLREDGIAVVSVYGNAGCPGSDEGGSETAGLLGALGIIGRDDLAAEVIEYTHAAAGEFGDNPKAPIEPECLREIRRFGEVGFEYWSECVHVQPDTSLLNGEAGADYITKIAAHIVEHLGALRRHVDDVEDGGGARA